MAYVKGKWVSLLQPTLSDALRLSYRDPKMIPIAQFRRAVERFERATRCLKCARAAGQKERVSILFEYRMAKRELLDLGRLLITGGEVPLTSLGPDKLSSRASEPRIVDLTQAVLSYSKPKSPEASK